MGHCWFWDLDKVIDYKLWLDEFEDATTRDDIKDKMRDARAKAGVINSQTGRYSGKRPYEILFK